MLIFVDHNAARGGNGSKDAPFQTISLASDIAVAGDEVVVMPGVYREWVNPKNSGADNEHRITYRSAEKGKAVITGAEPVKSWAQKDSGIWSARIPNGLFGSYNPYTDFVRGDWYFPLLGQVHTGDLYLNGNPMYEAGNMEAVVNPVVNKVSWDPASSVYKWYTEQDGGVTVIFANFQGADPNKENVEINVRKYCFHPDKTGVNYITLSGFRIGNAATQWAPPTAYQEGMIGPHWSKGWIIEDCEVFHSRCSGISLGKYLQPNNENKWTTKHIKDGTQTERDAICQAYNEGWSKERIGSHIVRRCDIHNCGQTGIVGHLGGVFSVIEDNHIHHINNRQDLFGAEIAGIKMHAAIDVQIRRNHIHHCTRGIWLDWQAQGTRVTQNLLHDNAAPVGTEILNTFILGEDIFVEVSHGPTLIDNNILLSHNAARLCTQGLAFVHNLIAGSLTYVGTGTDNGGVNYPTPRYTPYHVPHSTAIAGFMTFLHGDARFYNNIFVQQHIREDFVKVREEEAASGIGDGMESQPNFICGTKPYDGYPTAEEYAKLFEPANGVQLGSSRDKYYDHLPVYTGGNVFFNDAQRCDKEKGYAEVKGRRVSLGLKVEDGRYTLETDIYKYMPRMETQIISTALMGEAFEPEQMFENPDGSEIVINTDYFGAHRAINPLPGPFENTYAASYLLAEQ